MAGKKQQTHAKRARELAVKEKRERKRAKKAERAAGGAMPEAENGSGAPESEGQTQDTASDWIS
jgi:hypothetical protein